MNITHKYADKFGERFTVEAARREEFSKDPSFHTPHLPDAVVFPNTVRVRDRYCD